MPKQRKFNDIDGFGKTHTDKLARKAGIVRLDKNVHPFLQDEMLDIIKEVMSQTIISVELDRRKTIKLEDIIYGIETGRGDKIGASKKVSTKRCDEI